MKIILKYHKSCKLKGRRVEKNGQAKKFKIMDKVPYEILTAMCFIVLAVFATIGAYTIQMNEKIYFTLFIISYIICYISLAIWCVTTLKRLKAHEFWHSFLVYKIWRWCKSKLENIIEKQAKTKSNRKIILDYTVFIIISIILISMHNTGIGILLLIAFWIGVLYKLLQYNQKREKIKKALKTIYEGKEEYIRLQEDELTGILKEMAVYINDIAGGFSNAIQESLKSERLKTELITNVSHDIKTPLTSIINYVDLLKKEDIQNEKAKEYIEILDKKSQRLKKLTEDLVEASKVSSGNVKLKIEIINLKELLNQTTGEFEDRFESRKLKIEMNLPETDIKIQADNRYMYRIIENIFSNITKYALEGSRVYIDLENIENKIHLSIKNISQDKLNISADELMQRFVRGDRSRYTEGSGLGLSIAKSLTELQGGEFSISIDGDLFKVEIFF